MSIDSGAVETPDGAARPRDQGFAKKIERRINEYRRLGGFSEFVKQLPKTRINLPFDSMDAHGVPVKGEALKSVRRLLQSSQ